MRREHAGQRGNDLELAPLDIDLQNGVLPVLQQCIQAKLTQECKNQMSNAQKHVKQALPQCTESSQRYMQALKSTCGNATNENESCYKKVQLEFAPKIEAACKGMR